MTEPAFPLPIRADAETAAELLSRAISHSPGSPFEIDASQLEAIDGAATLTLANISHTFAAQNWPVTVVGAPPALIDAFQDLGLHEQLMKMEFRK